MRKFDHSVDMTQLNNWLDSRDLPKITYKLPRVGFIVDDVACGFLCQTDSVACFLDPFYTNPLADGEKRHLALDLIVDEIDKTAKEMGFDRILFITFEDSFKNRGKRHGFLTENVFFGMKEL